MKLTRDFYMMRYEVTQAQYEAVNGSNPAYFNGCGPRCPVESVSWSNTVEFANALSDKLNLQRCYAIRNGVVNWTEDCDGFRLPTEAEWEFAASAGKSGHLLEAITLQRSLGIMEGESNRSV